MFYGKAIKKTYHNKHMKVGYKKKGNASNLLGCPYFKVLPQIIALQNWCFISVYTILKLSNFIRK
ncbi:hypothetical protein SAMN04487989_102135 [Bizionia echini]|uniref:Uncharacterized protein n=1 Tax=Bizionia echini TaxID=649333 RepID=A0A1I5AL11_9FLAO|nr:hypothetical protein SAMN04487989_102135 [Bizionia echini]